MKTSRTFGILFWINHSRAKKEKAELYARITVNGKRCNISLKHKVNVGYWDGRKSRLRGRSKEAQQTNEMTRNKIFQSYMDLKAKDAVISAQAVKAKFLGEDEKHPTMQELISYHNNKMKHVLHKDTMRHSKGIFLNISVKNTYRKMFLLLLKVVCWTYKDLLFF